MEIRQRALWALVLASAGEVGCASAPPPATPKPAVGTVRASGRPRRPLLVSKPKSTVRKEELEALVEDVPDPGEAKKQLELHLGAPALPLERATSPSRVTALSLLDTARGETPGMAYGEELVTATLHEGQRASMKVTIAPGACAAYIAQGGIGLVEVDLFLALADRKEGLRVLAEDGAVGPIAVVGGRGKCHENTESTPLEAELHVVARRGAGPVLVRGYRRKK